MIGSQALEFVGIVASLLFIGAIALGVFWRSLFTPFNPVATTP